MLFRFFFPNELSFPHHMCLEHHPCMTHRNISQSFDDKSSKLFFSFLRPHKCWRTHVPIVSYFRHVMQICLQVHLQAKKKNKTKKTPTFWQTKTSLVCPRKKSPEGEKNLQNSHIITSQNCTMCNLHNLQNDLTSTKRSRNQTYVSPEESRSPFMTKRSPCKKMTMKGQNIMLSMHRFTGLEPKLTAVKLFRRSFVKSWQIFNLGICVWSNVT